MSRRDGTRRTGLAAAGVVASALAGLTGAVVTVAGSGTAVADSSPAGLLPSVNVSLPLPLPTTSLPLPTLTTTSAPVSTKTPTPVPTTTTPAPTGTSGGSAGSGGSGGGTGGIGGTGGGTGGGVHTGSLAGGHHSAAPAWGGSGNYGGLSYDPQLLSGAQLGLGQFGFAGGSADPAVRPPVVAGPPAAGEAQPAPGRSPDPAAGLRSLASAGASADSHLPGGLTALLAALAIGAVAAGHFGIRRTGAHRAR